jgi:hypothetical protein
VAGLGVWAAAVWLGQGAQEYGWLAGVLLPLAVLAGPVRWGRQYARARWQAVLDRFADRQLAQEREHRERRLTRALLRRQAARQRVG